MHRYIVSCINSATTFLVFVRHTDSPPQDASPYRVAFVYDAELREPVGEPIAIPGNYLSRIPKPFTMHASHNREDGSVFFLITLGFYEGAHALAGTVYWDGRGTVVRHLDPQSFKSYAMPTSVPGQFLFFDPNAFGSVLAQGLNTATPSFGQPMSTPLMRGTLPVCIPEMTRDTFLSPIAFVAKSQEEQYYKAYRLDINGGGSIFTLPIATDVTSIAFVSLDPRRTLAVSLHGLDMFTAQIVDQNYQTQFRLDFHAGAEVREWTLASPTPYDHYIIGTPRDGTFVIRVLRLSTMDTHGPIEMRHDAVGIQAPTGANIIGYNIAQYPNGTLAILLVRDNGGVDLHNLTPLQPPRRR